LGAPARRARASVAPATSPPDTDCAAAIQSSPIESTQKKGNDSDHDTRTPKTGEQFTARKRLYFKNPIGVPSYLACSGDGGGLIIGIGDIALAGEKHLSVAISASMAAGWTGVGLSCYQ